MGEAEVKKATEHPDNPGAGAEKRESLPPQDKVEAVMKEHKAGTLHSGSGEKVPKGEKGRDQAIAIAMSEAGLSKPKHRAPRIPWGGKR